MSCRVKRGFTIVELLVVVAVQFILLVATGMLLTFTLSQCGRSTAAAGSLQQADVAMNDMAKTVQDAYVCAVVTQAGAPAPPNPGAPPGTPPAPPSPSVTGLRCTMPSNAVDTDGDGVVDTYYPTTFDKNGKATYTAGRRIWYYLSDATGAFGNSGTVLWRAIRTDDANPTAADVDKKWAYYYGVKSRFPLVSSLSFTVTASTSTTSITLVASGASYSPERYDSTANVKDTQTASITRTLLWRTQFE